MRFLRYIFCALLFVTASVADTININWINGDETYAQTTCEIGGDIILPTTPTKRGYTLVGWKSTRYQPVEYIGVSRDLSQHIDTGIVFDNDTDEMEYEIKFASGDVYHKLFGAGTTSGIHTLTESTGSIAYGGNRGDLFFVAFNTSFGNAATGYTVPHTATLTVNRRTRTMSRILDGSKPVTKVSTTDVVSTNTIYLGAAHVDSGSNWAGSGSIYYFRVKKDGVLVGDFQPVKRTFDGVYGFYDRVTKTFFENAGAGAFTGGPIIESPFLE